MFSSMCPSVEMNPIAPQYGPRETGSTSSMICIARIFGAPVTLPPGNVARRSSTRPT